MMLLDREGRLLHRLSVVDVLIAGVVLALVAPLFHYGYRNLMEQGHMWIDSIEPTTVVVGAREPLTILGSGFDDRTDVQVGELSFQRAHFVNSVHLEAAVPLQIGPGTYHVFVKTGRGRLVIRENALRVIWQPQIDQVNPSRLAIGQEEMLVITGKYFEEGCTVAIGAQHMPHRMEYWGPTELRVQVAPEVVGLGTHAVTVTNPNGASATLENAVQVVSQLPPRGPRTWSTAVLVTCAFRKPEPTKIKELARGAIGLNDQGRVAAKILDILGATPGTALATTRDGQMTVTRKPAEGLVLASLLLSTMAKETRRGTTYSYQDQAVGVGIQLPLRFHTLDTVALILSSPTPVSGNVGDPFRE